MNSAKDVLLTMFLAVFVFSGCGQVFSPRIEQPAAPASHIAAAIRAIHEGDTNKALSTLNLHLDSAILDLDRMYQDADRKEREMVDKVFARIIALRERFSYEYSDDPGALIRKERIVEILEEVRARLGTSAQVPSRN